MADIILSTQNGEPVASSRQIAESFEKRHDHVMRDIDTIKKDVPNFGEMFFETEAPDSYGRPQRAVEQGLFEIKETTVVHSDGHTSINKTPKVTGKGQIYFVNLFLNGRAPAGRLREGGQNA